MNDFHSDPDQRALDGAQVLADAVTRAAEPTVLERGNSYAFQRPDGEVQVVDWDLDRYLLRPRRKQGTVHAHDPASLLALIDKHKTLCTEVYADVYSRRVTAVLNSHDAADETGAGDPGWGDHRAVLDIRETDEWKQWMAHNGEWMGQDQFAEFVEDHISDISDPDAATLLEVAQSISAKSNVSFESSKRLSNGQASFEYREEINGSAGEAGTLEIPTDIGLTIVPFEGGEAYQIRARFRYRINQKHLVLSYKLNEPDRIIRHAFDGIVTTIESGFEGPVFRGTPPA